MMDGGMLLLAAALSIDALNIGIICGCENIRMAWTSRLLMAAVTMVTTAAAVAVGYGLQGLLIVYDDRRCQKIAYPSESFCRPAPCRKGKGFAA